MRHWDVYNVRVGYVGGPLDTAVPTHLWALSHATKGEVLHEYVRVDLAQGTETDTEKVARELHRLYPHARRYRRRA